MNECTCCKENDIILCQCGQPTSVVWLDFQLIDPAMSAVDSKDSRTGYLVCPHCGLELVYRNGSTGALSLLQQRSAKVCAS